MSVSSWRVLRDPPGLFPAVICEYWNHMCFWHRQTGRWLRTTICWVTGYLDRLLVLEKICFRTVVNKHVFTGISTLTFTPVCLSNSALSVTALSSYSVIKVFLVVLFLFCCDMFCSRTFKVKVPFPLPVAHSCCHPGVHDHDGHLSHCSPWAHGWKNHLPGCISR